MDDGKSLRTVAPQTAQEGLSPPRRWKVKKPEKLLWRSWHEMDEKGDYLTLLYHTESDDTHLLNALGARILEILCGAALSEEELQCELGRECDGELPKKQDLELFLYSMTHAGILEEIDQEPR